MVVPAILLFICSFFLDICGNVLLEFLQSLDLVLVVGAVHDVGIETTFVEVLQENVAHVADDDVVLLSLFKVQQQPVGKQRNDDCLHESW